MTNTYRTPFHQPKKRVYVDCTGCGRRTWSPAGLCSKCSNSIRYYTQKAKKAKLDPVAILDDIRSGKPKPKQASAMGFCDVCTNPATVQMDYGSKFCAQCAPEI